jgi:hypothetical protein
MEGRFWGKILRIARNRNSNCGCATGGSTLPPGPSAAADEGPGAPQLDKIPRETGAARHTRVGKRLDCWENDCINRVGVHGDVYLAASYPLSKRTKGTKRLAGLSIRESVPRDQPRCPFGMDSDRFGN